MTHEKSSGRNLGSVFVNLLLKLIEEVFQPINNSLTEKYPTIINQKIIRNIRIRFLKIECLQTTCVFPTEQRHILRYFNTSDRNIQYFSFPTMVFYSLSICRIITLSLTYEL